METTHESIQWLQQWVLPHGNKGCESATSLGSRLASYKFSDSQLPSTLLIVLKLLVGLATSAIQSWAGATA